VKTSSLKGNNIIEQVFGINQQQIQDLVAGFEQLQEEADSLLNNKKPPKKQDKTKGRVGKNSFLFIGIDPGANGALFAIDQNSKFILSHHKDINNYKEKVSIIKDILDNYLDKYSHIYFAIEQPLYFVPKPKKGQGQLTFSSSNAAGKLGKSQGEWVGAIYALCSMHKEKTSLVEVSPATWNKYLRDVEKLDGKSLKTRSKKLADKMFKDHVYGPRGGYLDGLGDAAGIAVWCRHINTK